MQYRPIFAVIPLVGVPFCESGNDISGLFLHLRLPFHNFDYLSDAANLSTWPEVPHLPRRRGPFPLLKLVRGYRLTDQSGNLSDTF
jgi:hypothetical protein